jgi:hypothetical protein
MHIEDFNKLEKEIKQQDFNNSYSRINKALYALSIMGNFGSIFLAYFFMSKLITDSVTSISSPMIITIISLVILGSLEIIKREVFDKWSLEAIRSKFKLKGDVAILAVASLIVISFSVYSSLNGAKEFSSKNEVLETELKTEVNTYSDSLNTYYYTKIEKLEKQNETLFESNQKLDEQIAELPSNYVSARNRIVKEKETNTKLQDKNEVKIKEYKAELDAKIKDYESSLTKETSKEQEKNTGNSSIFIFISAVIETLILVGIFFNKAYKFRSYTDFKDKINRDPNYQKWFSYNQLLDTIYPPDSKPGDKVPSMNTLHELCKINSVSLNLQEIGQCMKLFNSLKITKSSGPIRSLNKDKDESYEILKTHFKID